MHRVAIFMDGGYVDKIMQNEFGGASIDYEALSGEIACRVHPQADILRSYYYHCLPYQSSPSTPEEDAAFSKMQSFLDAIDRRPRFVVKKGRLARRGPDKDGNYFFEQKMIDVYLSIDLVHISLKGRVDHAVIVAGDSDFVPAIEMVRNEGIVVWLLHGRRLHHDLRAIADERIEFTPELVDRVRWSH